MLISSNAVALGLIAVVVKSLKPSNKLISKVSSTSLILVSLLLVICGIYSSRICGASSLNLLKQLKKGLLYRHTVVLAISTPNALPT